MAETITRAKIEVFGKHPSLLIHQNDPLNIGLPANLTQRAFLTPQTLFFVRSHGSIPYIRANEYRLSIGGLVTRPLGLSLRDLRSSFTASTVIATLQCAGHRRSEMNAVEPIYGEVPWGTDAISNAVWRGVPLREVLLAAGVGREAAHVAFTGLDEIQKEGQSFGFGGSIPLEKALSSEVLLAYEMNGEPLPPLHGFPLRVVVPGYIGARSVKWLAGIHLQEHPSTNYYQRRAYQLFPPHVRQENADWARGEMLGPLPLNSVICTPCQDEILRAGPTIVRGYAIAGEGSTVTRVEVSADGGQHWQEASLQVRAHPWAWRFWKARFDLRPGPAHLVVRAWDSHGQTQPAEMSQVWNWKGYMNHAWHRVNAFVR